MTTSGDKSSARTSPSSAAELDAYFRHLTERLEAVSGLDLVGVYVGGSYALGGYEPGRSDVDVAAVTRAPATLATRRAIVAAIRHEVLPCPARGLEFVLYPLETVRTATVEPGFDLNLNTGREMPFRLDLEPVSGDDHWFAIDRSILQRHGITLVGAAAGEVFAPIPRELLLPVIVESLRWHERGDGRGDDAVLNGCRALRFAVEDVWSTKAAAGRWALEHVCDTTLVRSALERRAGSGELDRAAVERFLADISRKVEPFVPTTRRISTT